MTTPVGSIKIDLSIDGSNVGDEITEAVQKHAQQALADFRKELADLQSQMQSTSSAGKGSSAGVKDMGEAARKAADDVEDMARSTDSATSSTKQSGDAARDAGSKVEDAGRKSRQAGKDAEQSGRGFRGAAASMGEMARKAAGLAAAYVSVRQVVRVGQEVFGRAAGMEQTEAALTGLLGSAESAGDMMQRLRRISQDSSLEYSAYEAAAQSLAYMAIEGDQAESILRNVGNAIVVAGGDSSSLDRATQALTRMVNAGKVQMDTLQQLSGAGVPIIDGLAVHLGVTVEELNKMVSDGVVQLEDVLAVMEHGTGTYFEQMLSAAGDVEQTIQARWARLKDNTITALTGIAAPVLDALGPVLDFMAEKMPAAVESVTESLRGLFTGDSVSDLGEALQLERAGELFGRLGQSIRDMLPPLVRIAETLGRASAAVGVGVWQTLLGVLEALVPILSGVLVGTLEVLANLLESNEGLVRTLATAFVTFRVAMVGVTAAAKGMAILTSVTTWLKGVHAAAATTATQMTAAGTATSLAGGYARNAAGRFRGLIGAINPLTAVVAGGAAVFGFIANKNAEASRAAEDYEAAVRASEQTQRDLNNALIESNGLLDENARRLGVQGISDIVGELDAASESAASALDGMRDAEGSLWGGIRGQVGDWLRGDATTDSLADIKRDQAEAAAEAKQAIDDLGLSHEQLFSQVSGTQAGFDALISRLDNDIAIEKLREFRAEVVGMQEAGEVAGPVLGEMAETLGTTVEDVTGRIQTAFDAVPQDVPINIDMPGGQAVYDLLTEMGAEVELIDGKYITLDMEDEQVQAAIRAIETLVGDIETLPDGQVKVNVDTDEANRRMAQFMDQWSRAVITPQLAPGSHAPGGGGLASMYPQGRADGGVLPGWSPGRDNMLWPLSGGEGILIPEAVRGLGGPAGIYAINSRFRGGLSRRGYADGGVHRGSGALPGPLFDDRDDDEPLELLEEIRDLLAGHGAQNAPLNITARSMSTLADRAIGRMPGMTPGRTGPFGTPIAPRNRGYEMAAAAIQALGGDPERWLGAEPVSYWRDQFEQTLDQYQKTATGAGGGANVSAYAGPLAEFARTGNLTSSLTGMGLAANDPIIKAIVAARNKKDADAGAIASLIESTLTGSGFTGQITKENSSLVSALEAFRDKVGKDTGTAVAHGVQAAARTSPASFNKANLMPATAALGDAVLSLFPQIQEIGGYRQDWHSDHPSGRAIDIMIPGGTTRGGRNPAGKALGDQIWNWLMSTGVVDPQGSLWQTDTGGDHYDHIHARIAEGMENAAIQAGLIPPTAGGTITGVGTGAGMGATGGVTPVYVTNWPGAGGDGAMLPGLDAILGGAAQGGGQAASNVLGDVMGAVAGLGQEDWATRGASYATLNKLLRERNPAALAAALGLDVEDFTRAGGGEGDITTGDGPVYDSSGRLHSNTAALLDRTFTSLNAQLSAMREQMVSVIEQVSHKLNDAALEPVVKAGVQSALEGLKDSVSHAIGTAMGQAAAPPIADAVRSSVSTLQVDAGGGDGGALAGLIPGMATGGPVVGGVPGRDSVPRMLMPNEHVLTTDDVARMGGHAGVYAFRRALAQSGGLQGMATGGAVVNDVVGAEFFGVSQIPIIGLIVNILIRVLLSVLGVQIEARNTLLQMSDEFRQFRGDFQAFDAQGRLLNDTSALVDRAQSSEEMAAQERIRILKIVIEALVRYIIEKVIVPIGKAVANAAISAGASAAGAAINTQAPGAGGIVSSLISAAGSAGVDIVADVGTDLALAISETVIAVVAEGLQSLFPNLMTTIFGGGLLSTLLDPIGLLLGNAFGGLLGSITALLGGLFGGASTLIPGLPFDRGGLAVGTGLMPKSTIAPERVLSPRQTEAFERLVAALERNPRAADSGGTRVEIHAPITVDGGPEAGRRVRDGLLELMS